MNLLIDRIKAGSEHSETIDWPGTDDCKVAIRLCSENDNLQATLATDVIFKGYPIGAENATAYDAERETQLLFRAVLDPETNKSLFLKMLDFRQILTPEIKDSLAESLDELHQRYSPDPSTLTDEEFDALVQNVKKNGEAALANVYGMHTLKRLSIFLASPPSK